MNITRKSTFVDRVNTIIQRVGGIPALAERSGLSEAVIHKYKGGKSDPSRERLLALALAADVDVGWLISGEGSPERQAHSQSQPQQQDTPFVTVPRYSAAASAGGGAVNSEPEKLGEIAFSEEFIRRRLGRSGPKGLIAINARGDSMAPTLRDGDLVLIDTAPAPISEGVYAFTFEDALFVKRLQRQPGGLLCTSDNPDYREFMIEPHQMDQFHLLGRVVWVGHTL